MAFHAISSPYPLSVSATGPLLALLDPQTPSEISDYPAERVSPFSNALYLLLSILFT